MEAIPVGILQGAEGAPILGAGQRSEEELVATRIPSPKPLVIACAALALFASSPAKAATIVAWFDQTQTVGDSFTLTGEFSWGSTPFYYVQKYEALVSYDPSILQPQRVRFSSELGSPDVISAVFDPVGRFFIPDQFGAGDALTIASHGIDPLHPPGAVETILLSAYSLVFEELHQVGLMTFFVLTFDALEPGTSPLTVSYRLNNQFGFSQAPCPGDGSRQDCSVNVQPIPEPSTVSLMLVGAPWLIARLRRRRST
ncbi:MAG TPA: PEP-CTERM sorting domain-containing protein [Vicinamibacterales bacterium]|nr:PEP-CTERM sorting domain-containing protein [Vicinamibacterales bacterium]